MPPAVVQNSILRSATLLTQSSRMKRSRACANLASLEFSDAGPLVAKKTKLREASAVKTKEFRHQSLFLEAEFAFVPGFCDADSALAVWMEPCSLADARIPQV
ncbi:hypothetical protein ACHHYP_20230 [Achlya hypogyna]|uniref:Uncharacterized protein n=1 Tax=Achlya hypogyna TaxID=1202772 RepID=A0A1V9YX51_ACHHY|nr:hypothetical protein ACHHYP_20230 [Achlya hypogyna]